ncbi:MAG: beta strand repeat-containing protein [Candidatus Binataceae bacterium]
MLGGFLQACGGGSSSAPVTNLKSLTIDPVNSSIAIGTKVQLHATGTFENKTTKDVTESVTWGSADPKITTVSNAAGSKGLATGGAVGATIVAVELQGVKGVSTSTVTQASLKSITVMPVNPVVAKGTTVQMAAFGNFSDGSVQNLSTQVGWSSANSSIAQVSNASGTQGLVTGLSAGNTPITATFNGIQGATTVTVTAATLTAITITVPVAAIAKGTTVQLTATCNFSDGTTQDCTNQVSWTSGNSGIAQVSDTAPSKGLVTGVGVGNTTVSGSLGGIQGSETATVTAATLTSITITGPVDTIAKGTTAQLTATGNFTDGSTQDLTNQVSWTSADNSIAQVSNVSGGEGLVTGINLGNTTIMATLNGIVGSATVTVSAATLSSITITVPVATIAKGTTTQLTATGNFTDGSTQDLTNLVGWTSADNTIAQVSDAVGSKGLVTGINLGTTTIMATLNGIVGSATVTVSAATLTSITITPPDPSIAKGLQVQLTAIGNFTDGSTQNLTHQVGWTSAANAIAQVSNRATSAGLVTGINPGTTTIKATGYGIQGSTTVTVTAATLTSIAVTPTNPSIAKGTTVQLTATGTFSDGTMQNLTQVSWTSAAGTIATVDPNGLVTGTGVGSAAITATQGAVSGSTTVTVTAAVVTSIAVTPANPSIAKGTTVPLTATCTLSDSTTQNCTTQVDWTSGSITIAQVSNVAGTQGVVTGLRVGSTSIIATLNGISGSTTVTVTAAVLTSITITPVNPTIPPLGSRFFTATANFSDGTTQIVTLQTSWISSNPAVGIIFSSNPPSTGFFQALLPGTTTITATFEGLQDSTLVTVGF